MADKYPLLRMSQHMNSVPAAAYRFVYQTATDHTVDIVAAQNTRVYGVLMSLPRSAGDWTDIAIDGVVPVEAGGVFAAGDPLIADAQGRAIKCPTGLQAAAEIAGYANEASSGAGIIASIHLVPRTGPLMAGYKLMTFAGHNLAGACAAVGLKVGDVIVSVAGLTTVGNAATLFETTVTVADQIQQSSATDLHASNYLALVYTG